MHTPSKEAWWLPESSQLSLQPSKFAQLALGVGEASLAQHLARPVRMVFALSHVGHGSAPKIRPDGRADEGIPPIPRGGRIFGARYSSSLRNEAGAAG